MKIPLAKNTFWLALIVLGVILAVFFVFDIYGRWGQIAQLRADLLGGETATGSQVGKSQQIERYIKRGHALPTSDWLEQYAAWKTSAQAEEKNCLDYYKQFDARLEGWFPGLVIKAPAGLPDEGDFKTHYDAVQKALIDELKKHNIEITDTPEEKALGFEDPRPANFKILQKRYWIQEKLFQVMIQTGVRRCHRINFIKKSSDLPAGLGVYIPFEIKVSLPGDAVAEFIYQMAAGGNEAGNRILITVKSIELSRPLDEIGNYQEKTEKTAYLDEKETWVAPPLADKPLLQLVINGNALDFDIKN